MGAARLTHLDLLGHQTRSNQTTDQINPVLRRADPVGLLPIRGVGGRLTSDHHPATAPPIKIIMEITDLAQARDRIPGPRVGEAPHPTTRSESRFPPTRTRASCPVISSTTTSLIRSATPLRRLSDARNRRLTSKAPTTTAIIIPTTQTTRIDQELGS